MSASKEEHQPKEQKEDAAAYYALHVALQTMKERCNALQQRLVQVENENTNLALQTETDRQSNSNEQNGRSDIELLRMKVHELTRQKSQLSEHITMVAAENRQLWRRLTKLTKDGQNMEEIQAAIKDMANSTMNNTHQNLIRSKTFTQNSPNPMLRQKLNVSAQLIGGDENASLEEISLKVLNDFLEGKAEFEKKCSEIIPVTSPLVKPNMLGFCYLNEEPIDADLQNDAKKCVDGMFEMKEELLRQQSDLKVALSSLRQRKVLEICSTCRAHPKKPSTADKIIETEDILSRLDDKEIVKKSFSDETLVQIDFVEQKLAADCIDKMCPMCGKVYSNMVKFDDFQEHVESHFIDDSEIDTSIERNYEIISHAVGNF